jgi:hypothetical protein
MSIQTIPQKDYCQKWLDAQRELMQLESLSKVNDKDELFEKWRTLPRTSLYLVASHYSKKDPYWKDMNQWDLFKIFDKAIQQKELSQNVLQAFIDAVRDVRNIVALRKLYAVLNDESKSLSEKATAFYNISKTNNDLLDQIKHCICIVNGIHPSKEINSAEELIKSHPDQHKLTIKTMIHVISQGYGDCGKVDVSFKKLRS